MDAPRLEACYFCADIDAQWFRLARVLEYTASLHCPGWTRTIRRIQPAPLVSALGITSHVCNTQKMEHWHRVIQAAPDGARVLLIDGDTMILRPLDDVWDRAFDLAYTTKQSRFPFNSGVVFVRVSALTKAFVSAWRDENCRMLGDRVHHQVWRAKYGGINQASLGCMLAQGADYGVTLAELPCVEWNCEDASWQAFDPAVTRIVHIKSALRRAVGLRPQAYQPSDLGPLVRIWQALDAEALQSARRKAS